MTDSATTTSASHGRNRAIDADIPDRLRVCDNTQLESMIYSLRGHFATSITCPPAHLTWTAVSIAVRWRVAPDMVVVTQLVTHMSAAQPVALTRRDRARQGALKRPIVAR